MAKQTKPADIRAKSADQLGAQLLDLRKEQFNLRFQQATGQTEGVGRVKAVRRDIAYSHLHQGWPDLLDQIWVSEEFVGGSRFALGDVKRVEVFNDHLHEGRERWRSDHGFVRALLRLRMEAA